jgi:HlyD family secretion protein
MNDVSMTKAVERDDAQLDEFLGVAASDKPWYKRPLVLAAIAAVIVLLLIAYSFFGGSAQAGYATEAARRQDLTVTVSATGNLQPTNQVEVGSEQSGLVVAVFVDNNDRVTRGQPLARLDTARLRDALVQSQAAVTSAQAQVGQAQASATQASSNLARLQQVWELSGGKVPARTELDNARAELQRNQAAVRVALAQVTQARAQVSSAQTALSKATIYSPVTGVVLSRAVDPGQTVAASLQAPVLFTIAEDLSQMELEVKVDEADVGQVKSGQSASFTVDAYPARRFNAQITRVDLGANSEATSTSTTSSGNVVAYTAVLRVDNPDQILRPGMTATAEIVTSEKKNVLVVPNAALRFTPSGGAASGQGSSVTGMLMPRRPRGGSSQEATIGRGSTQTVYVLGSDEKLQPRRVTVGESNGSVTEVTSGALKAGEKIVTGQLAGENSGSGSRRRAPSPASLLPFLLAGLPPRRRVADWVRVDG